MEDKKTIRIMFFDDVQKKFVVDTMEVEENEEQSDNESVNDKNERSVQSAFM